MSFIVDDHNIDQVYQIFKQSYQQETGQAWSEAKFASRARNWRFFGDPASGFVAVREQQSGLRKLVGVAGNPRSVLDGLTELQHEGGPLWGAVSAGLARMASKRGMIAPHLYPGGALIIRALMKTVPASVFGGVKPEVTKDGGVQLDYPDVGPAVKYLIGNRAYFETVLPQVADQLRAIPGASTLLRLLGFRIA